MSGPAYILVRNGLMVYQSDDADAKFPGDGELIENVEGYPFIHGGSYPPSRVTRKEFLDLFSFSELVTIEEAAATDAEVRVAKIYLEAAGDEIDLTDPKIQLFLDLLESKNLLPGGRKDGIKLAKKQQ